MKVFVTGATGYIGGSVAKTLVDAGHEVFGLVRDATKVSLLRNLGIVPVQGTLDDKNVLAEYAVMSDAVINSADSDHLKSIEVFLDVLSGSGKKLLHTSGSSIVCDDARGEYENTIIHSDDSPFEPILIRKDRVELNHLIRKSGIDKGIITSVITPCMIYGDGLGLTVASDQVPKLMDISRKKGSGVYIGKGLNRWSNVHIKDLTSLYLLALEKAPSGSMFFAENGEESLMTIAQSISIAINCEGEAVSWPIEEAIAEFGDWARFALASNSRIRADNARNLLGWEPEENSILTWIERQSSDD